MSKNVLAALLIRTRKKRESVFVQVAKLLELELDILGERMKQFGDDLSKKAM